MTRSWTASSGAAAPQPRIAERYDIQVRPLLQDLPGFHLPRGQEKPKQVDLALVGRSSGRRVLISCKWSIRSDREEQFGNDFRAYTQLEAHGQDFDYVLATNEFDPARLARACGVRQENALLFSNVVHVNPDGPRAAYNAARAPGPVQRHRPHPHAHRDRPADRAAALANRTNLHTMTRRPNSATRTRREDSAAGS
jgi:hypothetical protein